MSQLTQEEIRDELLSLFEENEEQLSLYTSQIEKIEDQAMMQFEMKVIGAKNKLVQDATITDDELEERYLQEVEQIRKSVLEDTNRQITAIVESNKN
jgi:hypothetical protein